jgi:hypothetical protein
VDFVHLLLLDHAALGDCGVDQQVNDEISAKDQTGKGMKPADEKMAPPAEER